MAQPACFVVPSAGRSSHVTLLMRPACGPQSASVCWHPLPPAQLGEGEAPAVRDNHLLLPNEYIISSNEIEFHKFITRNYTQTLGPLPEKHFAISRRPLHGGRLAAWVRGVDQLA